MKILQILPELNEGGVERGVVELNRKFVKKGLDSLVMSNGGKLQNQITKDGGQHIKFNVCSKNILTFMPRVFKLKKLLKQINPDIIHVRSRLPAWLIYFANKSLKIKIVSTVHGLNSVNFYSRIMTKADEIICVGEAVKEHIVKNYHLDLKNITVIQRGVDIDKFNPKKVDFDFIENFKNQYNLKNKFIVTSVGRITELKDYETFIKAIKIAQKEIPNIVGLIVGGVRANKQKYFQSLQQLVSELKMEENIIFTNSISQIVEIYNLSNVVVSSSKKPESFGRSIAEAISLNTPVVATNHGGAKEIIQENTNGYFFEIGDFKQLAKKIILAKDLEFDGFSYIKANFSLEKMLNSTIQIYKKVL